MTVIVGILCKDGVVMASDSAATFGGNGMMTIGQQNMRKVFKINDHILYSGTGAVGIAQLIAECVKNLWDKNNIKAPAASAMNVIGLEINRIVRPYLETAVMQRQITGEANQSICKSMIALPVAKELCLFNFDMNGSPEHATKELPFISLGSGQMIADPFLALLKRVLWNTTEPTVAEGRLVAVWTIDHVRRTNAGGVGGGIQLATLNKNGTSTPTVEMVTEAEVQEHMERIESAEQAFVAELRGLTASPSPPPPAPVPPPPA